MDWEDGSVYKVPVTRAWGPECGSLVPFKKKSIMVYIHNTIIGEAETGGSVELPGQLYILIRAPSSVRDHSSANKTERDV